MKKCIKCNERAHFEIEGSYCCRKCLFDEIGVRSEVVTNYFYGDVYLGSHGEMNLNYIASMLRINLVNFDSLIPEPTTIE